MPNKPLIIGITGGIGAGKSFVSKVIKVMGFPVYHADSRAKWLLDHNEDLKQKIVSCFGRKAYLKGDYNTKYFRQIAFKDQEALRKLNRLIHPIVGCDFNNWLTQHTEEKYIFKEAAIMIESKSCKQLDRLITIECPKEERVRRILKRDAFRTFEQVESIMKRQLSESERISKAHFVIYNDGKKPVLKQLLTLINSNFEIFI